MRTSNDVIVFDFFGVICSEIAPFWLAKYFSKDDATKIKATVVHSADMGELSQQEMFTILGEFAHVSPKQVEEEWWPYVAIDGDVVEMVRDIGINYVVALLTNSPAPFVRGILEEHNLTQLFDLIIVSSEEGCAKPNAAIYERMLERLSVQAENTLMIDDNLVNVKGAMDVGMNGLVFESSMQLRKALTDHGYLPNS